MRSHKVPFYFAQVISDSHHRQTLIVVLTSPKNLHLLRNAILSLADDHIGILHIGAVQHITIVRFALKNGESINQSVTRFRRLLSYKLTTKIKNS